MTAASEFRASILMRDELRCQRCNWESVDGSGLDAHHRLPRSRGGKDTLENCVTLCCICHGLVHDHLAKDWGEWITSTSPNRGGLLSPPGALGLSRDPPGAPLPKETA